MEKNVREYMVTKKNSLIHANYSLSLNEQKIVLILASLIKPSDTDFNEVIFKATELAEILNVVPEVLYRDMPYITENLLHKVVSFKDGDNLIQTAFISSAVYMKGQGEVKLAFSEEFKPYLLQVKESFTTYKLANALELDSKHSIRLYEILKSHAFKNGVVEISLVDLKTMLDVLEMSAYSRYADFKRKILDKSLKEVCEKTDVEATYEVGKTGRKVNRIIFTVKNKENSKAEVFKKGTSTPLKKTRQTKKKKESLQDETDVFSFIKTTYGYMTNLEVSDDDILTICELFNYNLTEFVKYRRFINRRIKNAIAHATDYVKRQNKYNQPKPVIRREPSLKEIEIPTEELTKEEEDRRVARMKELKAQMNNFLNAI